jgi:hypothetical protein
MKMNKLVKICMMVAIVTIVFGVYASSSYGQETQTTDDSTAPANALPPTPYVNAGKGYEIGGNIVLVEPGGSAAGNTALGYQALANNTTGSTNTASGVGALEFNNTGKHNTASGFAALESNTTGGSNTASGVGALSVNATGNGNTASGLNALYFNNGSYNTASGYAALETNSTGADNTAIGVEALLYNTTGSNNIAIGNAAANNVSAGNSNNIEIGTSGTAADNGVISIGTSGTQTSAFIAGIAGVTLPTAGDPLVCIEPSTGQLGTLNCATNGLPSAQQEVIKHQQVQIETLQRQNEELQQRMSRLEALITKK